MLTCWNYSLTDAPYGLNPFTFVSKPRVDPTATTRKAVASSSKTTAKKASDTLATFSTAASADGSSATVTTTLTAGTATDSAQATSSAKEAAPLAEEHMPRFVSIVCGSARSRQGLIDEILEQLKNAHAAGSSKLPGKGAGAITKAAIGQTLKLYGVKGRKQSDKWDVREDIKVSKKSFGGGVTT